MLHMYYFYKSSVCYSQNCYVVNFFLLLLLHGNKVCELSLNMDQNYKQPINRVHLIGLIIHSTSEPADYDCSNNLVNSPLLTSGYRNGAEKPIMGMYTKKV